jgi:hypothetical protein
MLLLPLRCSTHKLETRDNFLNVAYAHRKYCAAKQHQLIYLHACLLTIRIQASEDLRPYGSSRRCAHIYIGGTHRYSAQPCGLLKWLWLIQPPSP